ncbi:MAG: hypothetical protein AVDCRST_MAG88-4727, partial [uncultured Thermomicrobiales bacterium]
GHARRTDAPHRPRDRRAVPRFHPARSAWRPRQLHSRPGWPARAARRPPQRRVV